MHVDLDSELARLREALARGDHMQACAHLADFARRLDLYISREERALAGVRERAVAIALREHASLRTLVGSIAGALDRGDDRRAADAVGKLRSVLLLHLVKEEQLQLAP